MDNSLKRESLLWGVAGLLILAGVMTFFCVAHPLYIYDMDDWTYISYNRIGLPAPHYWNPTKVLPEMLFPLTAEFAINFILPLSGDYVGSLAIALGMVLSLLICVFIFAAGRFMNRCFSIPQGYSITCMVVVAIMMFMPFYSASFQYATMFYAGNANGVYNYAVPGLFNGFLVFVLWKYEDIKWADKGKLGRHAMLLLLIYLCINSNLFHSIVSMSYVAAVLTEHLFLAVRKRNGKRFGRLIKEYVRKNGMYLLILLAWFGSLILEASGDRAAVSEEHLQIGESFRNFVSSMLGMNKLFLLMVFGSLFAAWGVFFVRRKKEMKDDGFLQAQWRMLFGLFLTAVYLILLCAKVAPRYMLSSMVLWGIAYYMIMIFIMNAGYILEKLPFTFLAVPIGLWVLISVFVVTKTNYRDVYTSPVVKEISNDIVDQIVEADRRGEKSVVVYIPVPHHPDLPDTLLTSGDRIARTLFFHGLTGKYMDVTIEASQEKTEEFHFPIVND